MNLNENLSGTLDITRGSTSTLASSISTSSGKRRGLLNKINQGIQYIRKRFGTNYKNLTDDEIQMLTEQTHFTREEILDWHQRFLEDCPNGHMSKKQFIIMYKTLFPKNDAEHFARHIFRAFDLDNSNTIDFGEFLLGSSMTSGTSSPEKKLEWTFHVFDIDKNGLLTRRECLEVIECIVRYIYSAQMEHSNVNLEQLINKSKRSMMKIFDTSTEMPSDQLTRVQFVQGCLKDEFIARLLAPEISMDSSASTNRNPSPSH